MQHRWQSAVENLMAIVPSLLMLQAVTNISDGFDQVAVIAQLLPQGADMHIHGPGFA